MKALCTIAITSMLGAGVPSTTHVVLPDRIEDAVIAAATERLRLVGSAATVSISGRVSAQSVVGDQIEVVVGDMVGRIPRERVGVPVLLKADGRTQRSLTVWLQMSDVRPTLTYVASYAAHQPGESIQAVSASVDMACCAGGVLESKGDLLGKRLKRSVRAGQPMLLADLEAAPDVRAQQRVAIEVVRGPIRLQTQGVSLGEARVGERLQVRPDHSREVLVSRVMSKEKVVIE